MDKIKQNIENCKEALRKEYKTLIKNSAVVNDYSYRVTNVINIGYYLDWFYDILESMDAFSTNLDAIKLEICYDNEIEISNSVLNELKNAKNIGINNVINNHFYGYYLNIEYKYFGESRIIFPDFTNDLILFHFYTENSKYENTFYEYDIYNFPNKEISNDLIDINKFKYVYSDLKYSNFLNNYIEKHKNFFKNYLTSKLYSIDVNALVEKYLRKQNLLL
jgi:hypothetical protein